MKKLESSKKRYRYFNLPFKENNQMNDEEVVHDVHNGKPRVPLNRLDLNLVAACKSICYANKRLKSSKLSQPKSKFARSRVDSGQPKNYKDQ